MPITPVVRSSPPRTRRALSFASVGAVVALLAALTAKVGAAPVLVIGGAVVCVANAVCGIRLFFLADARRRGGSPARDSCGVGLVGVGLLGTGLVGFTLALRAALGGLSGFTVGVALGGLCLVTGVLLTAMLLMSGATTSLLEGLRRALDGLSVGVCLLFTGWVLVISPHGNIDTLGFWVLLLGSCAMSAALVVGLPAARTDRQVMAGAGTASLCVIGLSGLVLAVSSGAGSLILAPVISTLVAAPVLGWVGMRRGGPVADRGTAGAAAALTGYPVLAIPAAAAIAVALHRLIAGWRFDPPAVVLAMIGIILLALRELLAAMDVARYAQRVIKQEAQFRKLIAGSTDVIMILNENLVVGWQSPAAARQFGLSDRDVVGRHFPSMVHPDDAMRVAERFTKVCQGGTDSDRPALVEARLRDGLGRWRETESSISDQRHVPEVGGLVVYIRDVGERKAMQRKLDQLTYTDPLTGLANRRRLLASIAALRSAPRPAGVVLLLDLNGFDAVNELHGYDVGDAVLIEVARRLRANVEESDLPARLTGDEFAVVTEGGSIQAFVLATRIAAALAEPVAIVGGDTVQLTASIGLADVAGGVTPADVLRRAELARRRAHQLGRGRVEWFDEAVEQAMRRRMMLETELPGALGRGEFDVIYQPILDLVDRRPVGVEALLRWRHPRLGTLLPADFIGPAEDFGLMDEIGRWVLEQAVRRLAAWQREGRQLSMAVNISPAQLAAPELPNDIHAMLLRHQVPPDRLILEIAESGLARGDSDDRLARLRCLGVRMALDDFGAGPDSLTHLRRFPLDLVKIGPSFFDESPRAAGKSVPIIDVMVGLGRRLGLDVVAHGLERECHLEAVRRAGCRLGQGNLFAPPQPTERVEAYLDGVRPG